MRTRTTREQARKEGGQNTKDARRRWKDGEHARKRCCRPARREGRRLVAEASKGHQEGTNKGTTERGESEQDAEEGEEGGGGEEERRSEGTRRQRGRGHEREERRTKGRASTDDTRREAEQARQDADSGGGERRKKRTRKRRRSSERKKESKWVGVGWSGLESGLAIFFKSSLCDDAPLCRDRRRSRGGEGTRGWTQSQAQMHLSREELRGAGSARHLPAVEQGR